MHTLVYEVRTWTTANTTHSLSTPVVHDVEELPLDVTYLLTFVVHDVAQLPLDVRGSFVDLTLLGIQRSQFAVYVLVRVEHVLHATNHSYMYNTSTATYIVNHEQTITSNT